MRTWTNMLYVMFNKRAAAFYRFNHEPKARDFRPCKTLAASLLNEFKGISGKACLHGVDNNDAFVNVGN